MPPDQWTGTTLFEEPGVELSGPTLADAPDVGANVSSELPPPPPPPPPAAEDAPTQWVRLDPSTGKPLA